MLTFLGAVLLAQSLVTVQDPASTAKAKVSTSGGGALQVYCVGGSCSGSGGSGSDGGYTVVLQGGAWTVGSSALPTGAATSAKQDTGNTSLGNLDVALSTRTKPADQQHVIIDSSATVATTGPVTDAQLRASAVPVSLATAPTTPVTGTFWQATQPVSGTMTCNAGTGTLAVSLASAPTTAVTGTFWQATQPVSLASAPTTPVTGTFWQATQPVSGTFYQATQPVSGTVTANAGTNLNTASLALSATQTDKSQFTRITDGTRDGTLKASSTAAQAADTSLVVGLSPNSPLPAGSAVIGHVIADTGSTTAVTGNVTAIQATGTNLHVVTDATSVLAANQSVNVSQMNGVATSMGTGASGTGTQRVVLSSDSALAANQSVNLAQVAGATTATGNGTAAGSIRVSVASDSTGVVGLATGANTIGALTANQSVNTAQMNGVAVTMGNGASGTGVQRVTLASDSTGVLAATQSGTWSDRIVGSAGAALDAVNNASAPANVLVAGYQLQSGATATVGTSGQVGSPVASLDHVPYARLGGPVTWACSLDNIGATLTQCQGVGGVGLKYYITDIEIESTNTTAGLFLVRTGTGTNCGTGTASLFPSAATVPRMSYPANTAANPSVFHFLTPLVTPAASEICIICTATNTCTVQMTGYTAP